MLRFFINPNESGDGDGDIDCFADGSSTGSSTGSCREIKSINDNVFGF